MNVQEDEGADKDIIFFSPASRWFLVFPLISGLAALGAAYDDGKLPEAWWVSILATVLALGVFWVTFLLLGRSTFSEVVLAGDVLECKRSDLFNRGEIVAIPIAETSGWVRYVQGAGRKSREVIEFFHRGRKYTFVLSEAQYADTDAFAALAEGRLSSRPAAHADQGSGGDAERDDDDDDGSERVDVR